MSRDELLIRELAYQIWESEGCPEGQAARHWEMACVLAQTAVGPPPAVPVPRPRPVARPEPVELGKHCASKTGTLQPLVTKGPAAPKS